MLDCLETWAFSRFSKSLVACDFCGPVGEGLILAEGCTLGDKLGVGWGGWLQLAKPIKLAIAPLHSPNLNRFKMFTVNPNLAQSDAVTIPVE